jgi:hypothetical protein
MEQALATPKGIRTHIGSLEAAMKYRLRLNRARSLDRKLNEKAYPNGHKMHGGSEFDELVFIIRDDTEGDYWIYLEKSMAPTHVENIE